MSDPGDHGGLTGRWVYLVVVPGGVDFIATTYEAAHRFVLMLVQSFDQTLVQDPTRKRTFHGSHVPSEYLSDMRPGESVTVLRGQTAPPFKVTCYPTISVGHLEERAERSSDEDVYLSDVGVRFSLLELD